MPQELMSCPACHKKIAMAAPSCPYCGQPVDAALRAQARESQRVQAEKERLEKKRNRWVLLILFILVLGWNYFKEPAPHDWAESLRRDAVPACSSAIENSAQYGFEWQTFALEFVPRFPHVDTVKGDENLVLLSGSDNAKALLFKNVFGVMIPMEYSCLYDTKSQKVVQVQVRPR